MKTTMLSLLLLCCFTTLVIAQSSTISSSNIQLPTLTSEQIQAIASPQKGMMAFDSNSKCLKYYNGTEWVCSNQQGSDFESQNLALFKGNANNYDFTYDLEVDPFGNVYVFNYYFGTVTYGSTSFTNNNPIQPLFCLIKFSSSGQVIWAKDLGQFNNVGKTLTVDNSGNVYINGAKYLPDGTADVANNLSVPKPVFSSNGNVYGLKNIEGFMQTVNGVTFGCEGQTTPTERGIFAYDSNRNLLWVRYFCGYNFRFEELITDNAGNCYFTGYFSNYNYDFSGGTNPSAGILYTANDRMRFVGKYNVNGGFEWVKGVQNTISANDGITQLIPLGFDEAGNLQLSIGYRANHLTYGGNVIMATNACANPDPNGYGNAIELKISSATGGIISTKQDHGGEIAISSGSVYHINAYACPVSSEICPPKSSQKLFLKKNKANALAWVSTTNATLYTIGKGADNTIWIGGSFTGSIQFGSASLSTTRPQSMFLLRIKE